MDLNVYYFKFILFKRQRLLVYFVHPIMVRSQELSSILPSRSRKPTHVSYHLLPPGLFLNRKPGSVSEIKLKIAFQVVPWPLSIPTSKLYSWVDLAHINTLILAMFFILVLSSFHKSIDGISIMCLSTCILCNNSPLSLVSSHDFCCLSSTVI